MLVESDRPRARITTRLAKRDRWTAACPAEFAAPATKTSLPFIAGASATAAP